MACGASRALMELGLRVPDDVGLLAFDDDPWMQLVEPGIDTLAQPVAAMGHAADQVSARASARSATLRKARRSAGGSRTSSGQGSHSRCRAKRSSSSAG